MEALRVGFQEQLQMGLSRQTIEPFCKPACTQLLTITMTKQTGGNKDGDI
jgi:hypothetical protein